MANWHHKTNTLFFLTVTSGVLGCNLAPAWGDDTVAYQDYQYACGHLNSTSNLAKHNCDRLSLPFVFYTPANSRFIFKSKSDRLQYREFRSNDTGIADYLVSTIFGVYFPTLETVSVNSGGSFFGGIEINQALRLDAEIVGIFEGNTVEKAYFDLSSFLSLRLTLPLSQSKQIPVFYISPGIGLSELDDNNSDDQDTHLTWQLETGIAAPIYRSWGGYGGVKYVNQLSEDGQAIFAAECGVTLEL